MILEQFYLGCLAHASYVLIDERTKEAAVIDPQRDIGQYLDFAARHGATIRHVLLTHFHADFLAGHLELRAAVGAKIYLGARAEAEYAFQGLGDGDRLEFGDVRLEALETPGHTPESTCYLVYDLAKDSATPHAVFTGDTLFVGDVGRPDLMASIGVTANELAGWMYDSLHGKILSLPDETLVYPAHGAGSMCGKNLSTETFSTIGEQRRMNYALQPMTREAFQATVTAAQPKAPAYFGYDAALNKKERGTLDPYLERSVRPLALEEFLAQAKAGAQVVDTRPAAVFARGHLAGSLNVGLDGKYATWAGSVLDTEAPILLITEPGTEREATMRLGRIGFDRVVGYLEGGPAALEADSVPKGTAPRTNAKELAQRLTEGPAPYVLDIRGPGEWADGHIEGAHHLPLQELKGRLDEVPRDREVALICLTGYRSSLAASLLRHAGHDRVVDLDGGMEAWRASDLPTTDPSSTSCSATG